jgi:hypothetical protein
MHLSYRTIETNKANQERTDMHLAAMMWCAIVVSLLVAAGLMFEIFSALYDYFMMVLN